MGTWLHSGTARARQVGALVALLLALSVATVAAGAARAGAVELGISDSDASTVTEPYWAGLHANRVRIVVPYDLATTAGAAGRGRRANFERYRADAAANGVSLLVVLAPSVDVRAPGTNDPVAPSADEFAAGFAAFRASYPDVTTIAPWNEPNNRDTSGYPLGSNPQLAANYWLRAKAICPTCTLLAGDFAGIPGDDAYVDAYQAELAAAGAVPDVWAFHAHTDVNRFQVVGASDAPATRYYLSKLQGRWARSRIWIDEVGARFRDASGLVWGDASQRDAAGLLLGLATLDHRIDAIYYYNYSNGCSTASGCAVQDRGLVSPNPTNGAPPDYDGANRRRAAYDVIAARGPVILPVAALPPAVTIAQPAQGAALPTSTPTFTGRAATTIDSVPTVTLRIFPGAGETESSAAAQTLTATVVNGGWSLTAAPLADGIYTARAGQAGNPGSTGIGEDGVFTIDTVAPTTTITRGPGAVSGAHTQSFAFAASEPGATFTCSRDGARAVPCASPVTLAQLALGRHTFGVRARDAAGNVQRAPTRLRWSVVSLASALVPRLGGVGQTLASGLPIAAACEDRCRVSARLDLLGLGSRRAGTLASADLRRTRAGTFTLRLRPRGTAAAALAARSSAAVQLTLVLRARGARPLTVRRTVTLVRTGALAALAKHGLPATLACTSACSASSALWVTADVAHRLHARGRAVVGGRAGLPRGTRYVSLGAGAPRRAGAGATDVVLQLGRASRTRLPRLSGAAARVTALAGGPGTDPRTLSLPLALPR
ncbi:MAG TPA: hypothetical protein VFF79_01520 [Conexibacter sp.]|nr:hypothetical protein [Conexibacter sp.]